MTKEEALEFVHKTLITGNKERIQLVLKRYLDKFVFTKTPPKQIDIVSEAERIFNI